MDYVGIGLTLVFGFLAFAVKDMPPAIAWGGVALGLMFLIWKHIPIDERYNGPLILVAIAVVLAVGAAAWTIEIHKTPHSASGVGRGGKGGGGTIIGNNGKIFGGRGGRGGSYGRGGDGGSGYIRGDNGVVAGGDGGDAAQSAGKDVQIPRSGAEVYYEAIGKPLPTDLRGWGKAATPGTNAGAGLVKIEYVPKIIFEPPKSLFDLYQRDSYAGGYASIEQLDFKSGDSPIVKLEVTLSWGRNCAPKNLWVYVPDSAATFDILNDFRGALFARIEKLDVQARTGIVAPCIVGSSPDGYVPFSAHVYAYHKSALDGHHANTLLDSYAKSKLNLTLRGPDYFSHRKSNWSKEDSLRETSNSPNVIYFPGEK